MYAIKLKNGTRFFHTLKAAQIFKKLLETKNIKAVIWQRQIDSFGYIKFMPISFD